MKKKTYTKPASEIIHTQIESVMETWSIPVDNNTNNAINPGDEGDIGAKKATFDGNWGKVDHDLWED